MPSCIFAGVGIQIWYQIWWNSNLVEIPVVPSKDFYSSGAGSSRISSIGGASSGGPLSIELLSPNPSNDSNEGGSSSITSIDASIMSVDAFKEASFGGCLLYENPAPLWNLSA